LPRYAPAIGAIGVSGMARQELDPFEAGRLGLTIPWRDLGIWFACALGPFAVLVLAELHGSTRPEWLWEVLDGVSVAIFDWCWMAALCRTTARPIVTFPIERSFWLFLILQAGIAVVWWLFSALIGMVGLAAFTGHVLLLDSSGVGVQVIASILLLLALVLSLWVGLRLSIWPAHCVATGVLVGPQVIWRKMRDHSFDMLIISIITIGPILLFLGAMYFVLRASPGLTSNLFLLKAAGTAAGLYVRGAFDAASLIAYFAIFAGAVAEKPAR
jgi:hypothetical protein